MIERQKMKDEVSQQPRDAMSKVICTQFKRSVHQERHAIRKIEPEDLQNRYNFWAK